MAKEADKTNNLLASINHNITQLQASERITKKVLNEVARELLIYVPGSNDIDAVNRLLAVLTPQNKSTATLFFKTMLQWKVEEGVFTTILKGAREVQKKNDARAMFIKSDETYWDWTKANVAVEAKEKDFQNDLTNLVKRATKDGDNQISHMQVLQAVMAGGIGIDELMRAAVAAQPQQEAA